MTSFYFSVWMIQQMDTTWWGWCEMMCGLVRMIIDDMKWFVPLLRFSVLLLLLLLLLLLYDLCLNFQDFVSGFGICCVNDNEWMGVVFLDDDDDCYDNDYYHWYCGYFHLFVL